MWATDCNESPCQQIAQESYRRTVAPSPTNLAVSRDEAKVRLDLRGDSSRDEEIDSFIRMATEQIERDARQIIMTQTWQLYRDSFSSIEIELRKVPITAVNFVKYITEGTLTTLSPTLYQTDLVSQPARIRPVYGQCWPCADRCTVNAVQIEFVAGYATSATVPDYTKQVILAVVRDLFYGCTNSDGYWTMIQRLQTFGTLL